MAKNITDNEHFHDGHVVIIVIHEITIYYLDSHDKYNSVNDAKIYHQWPWYYHGIIHITMYYHDSHDTGNLVNETKIYQ